MTRLVDYIIAIIIAHMLSVLLVVPAVTSQLSGGCGTGFYVNSNGYMVTAAHVIGKNRGYACYEDGTQCGKIVGINYSKDVAYIKFNVVNTPYLTFSILDYNKKVPISIYGYPEVDELGYNLKRTKGFATVKMSLTGTYTFYGRANIMHGNSGGPALYNGNVVGSVTNSMEIGPAGLEWGTTSENIISFARSLGIKTYTVNQETKTDPKLKSIVYVCTGV